MFFKWFVCALKKHIQLKKFQTKSTRFWFFKDHKLKVLKLGVGAVSGEDLGSAPTPGSLQLPVTPPPGVPIALASLGTHAQVCTYTEDTCGPVV